jgi:hypothetical protein
MRFDWLGSNKSIEDSGSLILGFDVAHELAAQVCNRLGDSAGNNVALDFGQPVFDLVFPQTDRINLVTPGSRARNNDNRGNDTNTGDILFDQILFPAILRPLYVDNLFQIFDARVAIEGTGGQNGDQAASTPGLEKAIS